MADRNLRPDSGNDLVLEDAGSTDRLRITDGGSTILYEDGGAAALTIDTSGNTEIAQNIEQADGKNIQTDEVRARDGDGLKLYDDAGTAGIFIKDGGRVGIGTDAPLGTLHLQAASTGDVEIYFYADNGANPNDKWKLLNSYSTNNFELVNNGTSRFSVSPSGVFVGGASADISDERLKKNITSITNALTKIKALKGRTFEWKASANMISGKQFGLIAQELETVLPELVLNENGIRAFDKDGNLKPDESRFNKEEDQYAKSVSMTGCIPIIIEALKELSVKVEALENA